MFPLPLHYGARSLVHFYGDSRENGTVRDTAVKKVVSTATSKKTTVAKKTVAKTPVAKATIKKVAAPKATAKTTTTPKATVKKAAVPKVLAAAPKVAKIPAEKKPVSKKKAAAVSPQQRYQMISTAAYFLAERRGFSGGYEMQDWISAEFEIDAKLSS